MTEGSGPAPATPTPSLVGVLPDVVSGLRDKPALLFGIGAGVILVIVLGVTTDLWLVLIVAAVLVLALLVWMLSDARERRAAARAAPREPGGVKNVTHGPRATIRDEAEVGNVEAGAGSIENVTNVEGADVGAGARVGNVRTGGEPEQES
jgi:hypothetical protein